MSPRRSARIAKQQADQKAEEAATKATQPTKKTQPPQKAPKKKKAPTTRRQAIKKNTTNTNNKRTNKRNNPTNHIAPTNKKRRTTHNNHTNPASVAAPLGVVDPESKIEGMIEMLDGEPCDAMLVLVDPQNNTDDFFILQLIKRSENNNNGEGEKFVVHTRQGRTGTTGQINQEEFIVLVDAVKCFENNFEEKTGLSWENRNEPIAGGKFRFIQQDFVSKQFGFASAVWQYWVSDGVDGKRTGWYDYDKRGSAEVERLFTEHANNPHLTNRLVKSGVWTYDVDLVRMVQTNVQHANRTSRRIRRCVATAVNSGIAAAGLPFAPTITAVLPRPIITTAAATVTPPPAAKPAAKKSGGSHPVDPDVSLQGYDASEFEVMQNEDGLWYDVVLNQCNITGGNNNNKYYRIQLLQHKDWETFHVWQKWGRVGEPGRRSASALKGPFQTEAKALPVFKKKYSDKTRNDFGAETFIPHTGKYTLIEIDNDVEVTDDFRSDGAKAEVKYLPSKLDAKTKDLVQVLFSKEMRDEALVSFNLDLKRLPLGVPSQKQIQTGVDILDKIQDKLSGTNGPVAESFQELSSQFYTAIPHSFGRRRPPVVSTQGSLQSRYDMCNILLDMFTTNETIRKIEKETVDTTTTQVPNPADQHFDSLKTDMRLVDKKSDEYKKILKYFNDTKSSYSNSQMLDVWAVSRHGESDRFKKFNDMDNRRLLWHGTNIAVVAPILTSGLRIMPHSGGRVGAGIYLASMQQKSEQYTSGYGAKFACMFLAEAALGKMHTVTQDGPHASGLKKAPQGFDSVLAVGSHSPKQWQAMEIDGKDVQLPQSKGEDSGVRSSFQHDEFLAYEEAQVRLRYVITVKR